MEYFELTEHASTEFVNIDSNTMDTEMSHASVTEVTDMIDEIASKVAAKFVTDAIKKMDKQAQSLARAEAKAAKQAAAKSEKAAARAQAKADKEAAKVAAKEEAERINLATRQRFSTLFATGEALAKQHEAYETQYVTKANADKYVLLTNIHEYAEQVMADAAVDAVIKEMREELRWKYKIRTQKNSPDVNIIVRYVTRTNRKNACVYGRVIRSAIADGITSAGLTAYIVDARGIEKIRNKKQGNTTLKRTKKSKDLQEFYTNSLLHELAKTKPLATFSIDKLRESEIHDITKSSDFKFMICLNNGSEFTVIDGLPWIDEQLEQTLLQNYGAYKIDTSKMRIGEEKTKTEFHSNLQRFVQQSNEARKKHGAPLIDLSAADPFAETHQNTDAADDVESESESEKI